MAGRMSIESEIALGLNSFEIEHELDKFAEEVAEHVRSIAPEFGDRPPHRTEPPYDDLGSLKESITVTPGGPGRRKVGSEDYKAIWAELGTRHMPEYAPFAKTAKFFGGTGPIIDEGVRRAQGHLREELEKLEKMTAVGAAAHHIAAQTARVDQARIGRTAAFKAARGPRRQNPNRRHR